MHTQEIVCPKCGRMTSVNVPDSGAAETPCANCPAKVRITTDEHGHVTGIAEASPCFIATAAYGSADSDVVILLRAFRDQKLARGRIGRSLVRCYSLLSPPLAAWLAPRPCACVVIRSFLGPAARIVRWAFPRLGRGRYDSIAKITGANSRPALQFESRWLRRRAPVVESQRRYHGGAAVAQFCGSADAAAQRLNPQPKGNQK